MKVSDCGCGVGVRNGWEWVSDRMTDGDREMRVYIYSSILSIDLARDACIYSLQLHR